MIYDCMEMLPVWGNALFQDGPEQTVLNPSKVCGELLC